MKLHIRVLPAAIALSLIGVAVMAAIAVREIGKALDGVPFDHDEEQDRAVEFVENLVGLTLTDWQRDFMLAHLKGRDA